MTDRAGMEAALIGLRARIEYPPEVDLAPRVRARLEAPRPSVLRRVFLQIARPAAVATAIVVIACAFLIVSPGAREAVADFLGIDGVRIQIQPEIPEVGTDLSLGEPVDLAEARSLVDFSVLVPDRLGGPDDVYYEEDVATGQVALVYRAGGDLPPATPGSDAGVVVTEFEADLRADVYKKLVESSTQLEGVTVNGEPGFWIEGEPHVIEYIGPDGEAGSLPSRLVGNTLLWNQDGLTLRIESSLSLNEALAIAGSLR
jgi:hypothetical protein